MAQEASEFDLGEQEFYIHTGICATRQLVLEELAQWALESGTMGLIDLNVLAQWAT